MASPQYLFVIGYWYE